MKKILSIVGMLACMTAFAVQTVHAQQVSLDAAIWGASTELSADMEIGDRVAVVMIDLVSADMSNYLVGELSQAFARMGFTAADGGRPDLAAGSDAEAQARGRHAGARFVVTVSFAPSEDFFIFRTRLLDVESGDIRSTHAASIRHDSIAAPLLGTDSADVIRADVVTVREWHRERVNFLFAGVGTVIGDELIGFNVSLQYERKIGHWFSFGANGFFNTSGMGETIDVGVSAAARVGFTYRGYNLSVDTRLFVGLDLGFGSLEERYWQGIRRYSGLLVTPSLGYRLGARTSGFHIGGALSFPMVIGNQGFTRRVQIGALLGGAW